MDLHKRLTRFSEWKRNAYYQWLKGGELGEVVRCIELDPDKGVVWFYSADNKLTSEFSQQWRNRWVEVKP